jgi:hypothetical protein
MLIREFYPVLDHYGITSNKEFLCGCEFEIEDVKDYKNIPTTIDVTNDSSLRNNGKEFKTPPQPIDLAVETFKQLHSSLKVGKQPFSERTSIHVHVNVRELDLVQARQLVLLYALYEPLFFDFVGNIRKNSIFCVPLNYTYLPSVYKLDIKGLKEKWHKYTAFNIIPMGPSPDHQGFGTVEFRHLYGTNDAYVFETWLKAIKELYTIIMENPTFDILTELQGDTVQLAYKTVPTLAYRLSPETIKTLIADSTLDVKLSAGGIR